MTQLVKADKNLFAVYHTLHSGADTDMMFDWDKRLGDTTWSDDCYFVVENGKKIGGAVVTDKYVAHAFMIAPFCDRLHFWHTLLKLAPVDALHGVLDADRDILPMFGFKTTKTLQVMCCAADEKPASLPSGFTCRAFDVKADAIAAGNVNYQAHIDGADHRFLEGASAEKAASELVQLNTTYTTTNLSHVIHDDQNGGGEIIAFCLSGTGELFENAYMEVAEIAVLPQYKGRGLGRYMLSRIITQSYGKVAYVKLCVTIGNPAEHLYRRLGFVAGARFSAMERG